MKKILSLFYLLFATITLSGQTTNYALKNSDGNGYVETSTIKELDGLAEATFQLWIKPEGQNSQAKLLEQDNFALLLDENSRLTLQSGEQHSTLNHSFAVNQWVQISVTLRQGTVKFYIDNVEQSNTTQGSLPQLIAQGSSTCVIGKGFKGELDEIRIWKKALAKGNLYWRNTLNKFNPNHTDLVAYWKGDQELCENLVDYTFKHHGVFHNLSRVKVEDNTNFRYRIVTGYTNLVRFIDRKNIDRDMHLMTNDLILLSGKIQKDGSILLQYADNTGIPTKVGHIEEFNGRKGILDFQGKGSQLYADDGDVAYSPDSKFGRDLSAAFTLEGWFYFDSWKEGALLFSKRKDTNNCMEIRLGKERNKELIMELNGTVATLSNKVQIGKWHYLGFYFSPKITELSNSLSSYILTASVDYTRYTAKSATSGIKLSGNNMTLAKVPLLEGTPLIIGKEFDGKMDEVMAWGTNRSENADYDSKNPYQLNVGKRENHYLTAYWKGDDPQNIGKDSQSYKAMIEFMRNYYTNHRGMKIRLGIIYPEGDKWNTVLNQKENVDRLIADTKDLLPQFDGIDVDLEWHNYDILNPLIQRLVDEVMVGKQEKIFTVSQHEYSYMLDKKLITNPHIDYFTMQIYGPQTYSYEWNFYEEAYKQFVDYGYPKEKLLLSYGILLVNKGEEGYKDLFEKYGMNDSNYNPDLNIWQCGAIERHFNGVTQTKRKQEFILDKGCLGTMYFDMGNDQRVSDHKSLIRAQNEVISANVDTLVTQVEIDPSLIIKPTRKGNRLFSIIRNADKRVLLTLNTSPQEKSKCSIFRENGTSIKEIQLNTQDTILNLSNLNKGVYVITVVSGNQTETTLYNL